MSEVLIEDSTTSTQSINVWARRRTRRLLVQAVYQWQLAATPLSDLLSEFLDSRSEKRLDHLYFRRIIAAILSESEQLDSYFLPYLDDRSVKELDHISRAILRISTYELWKCKDVEPKTVIDEAVILAKTFGPESSYRYVNAVLSSVWQNCFP